MDSIIHYVIESVLGIFVLIFGAGYFKYKEKILKAVGEVSELLGVISQAVADDKLTLPEQNKIIKEAKEALQAVKDIFV